MSNYTYKPYTQEELDKMPPNQLSKLCKRLHVIQKETKELTIKAVLRFQLELERSMKQVGSGGEVYSEPPRYSVRLQRIMDSQKQKEGDK